MCAFLLVVYRHCEGARVDLAPASILLPAHAAHASPPAPSGSARVNRSALLRAQQASSTRRLTPTEIGKLKTELEDAKAEIARLTELTDSLNDSARDAATDLGEQLGETAAKHQDAVATSERLGTHVWHLERFALADTRMLGCGVAVLVRGPAPFLFLFLGGGVRGTSWPDDLSTIGTCFRHGGRSHQAAAAKMPDGVRRSV